MPKKHQARLIDSDPLVETEIISEKEVRRVYTKDTGYFSVYANDVQVNTGPWDVRLVLGEIGDSSKETQTVNIRNLGEMRISPQLAKRLTMILIKQLQVYEQQFGTIPALKD